MNSVSVLSASSIGMSINFSLVFIHHLLLRVRNSMAVVTGRTARIYTAEYRRLRESIAWYDGPDLWKMLSPTLQQLRGKSDHS